MAPFPAATRRDRNVSMCPPAPFTTLLRRGHPCGAIARREGRLAVVSDEEAEARRADRAVLGCIAVALLLAVLGAGVSFAFLALAFGAHFAAWGCAFWAAKAKGYPAYFGIMGPLFCRGLPSRQPTFERVRRWEAARGSRADGAS